MSLEKVFDGKDEWRLLADELSLLPGMTDTGRLGFALQLKFRQVQGHVPHGRGYSMGMTVSAVAREFSTTRQTILRVKVASSVS